MEILNEIIDYIHDNNLLNKDGLIVCEIDSLYLNNDFYTKIKEKKYGNR